MIKKGLTPNFFYNKLQRVNSGAWAEGDYCRTRDDAPGMRRCAMGLLGVGYRSVPEKYTDEQKAFIEIFKHYLNADVHMVNDGTSFDGMTDKGEGTVYEQKDLSLLYSYDSMTQNESSYIPTPKARVLGALSLAINLYNVEELIREDRRFLTILLDYLHRNPNSYNFNGYSITKS